jgi:hypothetical protein
MVVVHGKNEQDFYAHSKPNNFHEKWATVDSIELINSNSGLPRQYNTSGKSKLLPTIIE